MEQSIKYSNPRPKEFIDMLIKEYNTTNISIKELSAKYHTDVYYHFKKNGIKKRSKGEQMALSRTNCIKYNWDFSSIKNETEAYIIGLFLADGYVGDKQAGIKLKLEDSYIIRKIRDYLSPEIKISCHKNTSGFVISSQIICDNMKKLGIISKKSNKELFIPNMKEGLYRHFIRGFFDGDGSIFKCVSNKNIYLKGNICSPTINILEEIQTILRNNNIFSTINIEKRIGKTSKIPTGITVCNLDMYRLFIRRKIDILNLFHFMYDESTIHLNRKYLIFKNNLELLNYKKHVNTELTN